MDTESIWPETNFACSGGAGCVIVERIAGAFVIRDSKNPTQPGLVFSRSEYAAFRRRVKGGSRWRALAQLVRAAMEGLVAGLLSLFG
jgi:hypothetical protein